MSMDSAVPARETSDRALLLSLVGSLTFCDHMGDVADDVIKVLKELGIETPQAGEDDDWWPGLARDLHALGVTSLYGTELWSPDDEEDDDV